MPRTKIPKRRDHARNAQSPNAKSCTASHRRRCPRIVIAPPLRIHLLQIKIPLRDRITGDAARPFAIGHRVLGAIARAGALDHGVLDAGLRPPGAVGAAAEHEFLAAATKFGTETEWAVALGAFDDGHDGGEATGDYDDVDFDGVPDEEEDGDTGKVGGAVEERGEHVDFDGGHGEGAARWSVRVMGVYEDVVELIFIVDVRIGSRDRVGLHNAGSE